MTACLAPACPEPPLGQGHWPFLCSTHALALARLKPKDRSPALAAHDALHAAFKARNRHLASLGPEGGAQAPARAIAPIEPAMLNAIANVMAGLGARLVRVEPRYGDLPGTMRKVEPMHPKAPCQTCGSTNSRRAQYGLGGMQVWVMCTVQDACYARLRKAKADLVTRYAPHTEAA